MLKLSNGTQVRIISENENTVKVQSIDPCGFDSKGNSIFEVWRLSKKYHKGALLLDGIVII